MPLLAKVEGHGLSKHSRALALQFYDIEHKIWVEGPVSYLTAVRYINQFVSPVLCSSVEKMEKCVCFIPCYIRCVICTCTPFVYIHLILLHSLCVLYVSYTFKFHVILLSHLICISYFLHAIMSIMDRVKHVMKYVDVGPVFPNGISLQCSRGESFHRERNQT